MQSGYCLFHEDATSKDEFNAELLKLIDANETSLRGFVFPDGFRLAERTFSNVDFSYAVFKGQTQFAGCTFSSCRFDHARFLGRVAFGETRAEQEPYSIGNTAGIRYSLWPCSLDGCSFQNCSFCGSVEFTFPRFSGTNSFFNASFDSDLIVYGGHCPGRLELSHCKFRELRFDGGFESLLITQATASGIEVSGSVGFARINGRVVRLCLAGLTVDTKLKLEDFELPESIPQLDLRRLQCSPEGSVDLDCVDLRKAQLVDADVRKFHFIGAAKWPVSGKRKVVFDAIEHPGEAGIQELYRRLRLNFEEQHDFTQAADFHVGEMEERLRNEHGVMRWITWSYGELSLYGESCARALTIFALIWLIPAVCFLLTGVKITGEVVSFKPAVSMSFLVDGTFWDVLRFSLLNTIGQPGRTGYTPGSPLGNFMQVLQTVLGPVQIALLVLALRRAFRK